jgi:hypothetical protein
MIAVFRFASSSSDCAVCEDECRDVFAQLADDVNHLQPRIESMPNSDTQWDERKNNEAIRINQHSAKQAVFSSGLGTRQTSLDNGATDGRYVEAHCVQSRSDGCE